MNLLGFIGRIFLPGSRSVPASLGLPAPHPAPPVSAFQTLCVLCLNHCCSPWFSGWEPTVPVSMVTGKL